MTFIDTIGVLWIMSYIGLMIYGWRRQDDPFWRGFCDPFSLRRERKR